MGNLVTNFKKFLQNKNTVTVIGVILAIIVLYFAYTMRINSAISPVVVPYANTQIPAGTQIFYEAGVRVNSVINFTDLVPNSTYSKYSALSLI